MSPFTAPSSFVLRATMITIGAVMAAKIAPALVSSSKSMTSMVKGSIDFLKNNYLLRIFSLYLNFS